MRSLILGIMLSAICAMPVAAMSALDAKNQYYMSAACRSINKGDGSNVCLSIKVHGGVARLTVLRSRWLDISDQKRRSFAYQLFTMWHEVFSTNSDEMIEQSLPVYDETGHYYFDGVDSE